MEPDAWGNVVVLANRAAALTITVGAASTAGTLAWWKRYRPLSKEVRVSLATSIAAAVPGLALSIDVGARWFLYEIVGVDVAPIYDSPTMMLSVLWVLVAPWLLMISWAAVRPKAQSPKGLWLVLASHAGVWIASFSLVALLGIPV